MRTLSEKRRGKDQIKAAVAGWNGNGNATFFATLLCFFASLLPPRGEAAMIGRKGNKGGEGRLYSERGNLFPHSPKAARLR